MRTFQPSSSDLKETSFTSLAKETGLDSWILMFKSLRFGKTMSGSIYLALFLRKFKYHYLLFLLKIFMQSSHLSSHSPLLYQFLKSHSNSRFQLFWSSTFIRSNNSMDLIDTSWLKQDKSLSLTLILLTLAYALKETILFGCLMLRHHFIISKMWQMLFECIMKIQLLHSISAKTSTYTFRAIKWEQSLLLLQLLSNARQLLIVSLIATLLTKLQEVKFIQVLLLNLISTLLMEHGNTFVETERKMALKLVILYSLEHSLSLLTQITLLVINSVRMLTAMLKLQQTGS